MSDDYDRLHPDWTEEERCRARFLHAARKFTKLVPVGLLPSKFRLEFREMRLALTKLEAAEAEAHVSD